MRLLLPSNAGINVAEEPFHPALLLLKALEANEVSLKQSKKMQ